MERYFIEFEGQFFCFRRSNGVRPSCGYSYYGKPVSRVSAKGKKQYAYYRCVGTDACRFGGERICTNKQLRTDMLETAVWEDVCALLNHPERVTQEYQRRLNHQQTHPTGETHQLAEMIQKVKRGLTRLIDAYEDGLLSKSEFESRVRVAKQRLTKLETEAEAMKEQDLQEQKLRLVIGQFEEFAKRVLEGLQEPDWLTRREIIRALVKRIEIDRQDVRVIYKVGPSPFVLSPDRGRLQDCWRRDHTALRASVVRGTAVFALGPIFPSIIAAVSRIHASLFLSNCVRAGTAITAAGPIFPRDQAASP